MRDDARSPCAELSTAQRWSEASVVCRHELAHIANPWTAVRTARALYRAGAPDEALSLAIAWFDSPADATARQVAGAIYQRRAEHQRATPLFERALGEHQRAGDHAESARDAQMLAGSLLRQGIFGAAIERAELAVHEARALGDPHLEGLSLLGLGKVWAEVGDAAKARTAYWQAREVTAGLPEDQAWIYLELAILDNELGDRAAAARLLELALDLATSTRLSVVAYAARLNLARIERELGHLDAAERHVRAVDPSESDTTNQFVEGLIAADRGDLPRANRLLASAAADPPTPDYARDIAQQRGMIAERHGASREAESYYREAIAGVERLRANSALELRPWVLAHRREPYAALLALLAREGRAGQALAVAEQLHARTWRDALQHVGRATDLGKRWAPGASSEEELQQLFSHREAVVYATAADSLWRFHVVDGVVQRLDLLEMSTLELVERWRSKLGDRALAEQLGALLLPPQVFQPSQRPLYVVADGVLDELPFVALRHDGRALVEDRVVVRLPSAAALWCRAAHPSSSLTVFGDSRGDLPGARREALALAASAGAQIFLGEDVTLDRLRQARHAAVLHLALHAEEQAAGPSLLLARGSVSSADIVALDLSPALVVLAGCATAAGRDVEGWNTLAAAFLLGGTQAVVATLQSVGDADASALLQRFYALGGLQHPGDALARAQRELVSSNDVARWAPYAVYGAVDVSDCVAAP